MNQTYQKSNQSHYQEVCPAYSESPGTDAIIKLLIINKVYSMRLGLRFVKQVDDAVSIMLACLPDATLALLLA